jgi:hypothetical protein
MQTPFTANAGADWERTGVEPDVKDAATEALTTAQKLAEENLAAGAVGKDQAANGSNTLRGKSENRGYVKATVLSTRG